MAGQAFAETAQWPFNHPKVELCQQPYERSRRHAKYARRYQATLRYGSDQAKPAFADKKEGWYMDKIDRIGALAGPDHEAFDRAIGSAEKIAVVSGEPDKGGRQHGDQRDTLPYRQGFARGNCGNGHDKQKS